MSGGEVSKITEMAVIVSRDVFEWFKWKRIGLTDQNFDCVKPNKHAPEKTSHTHPVDVVFHYVDPYLNRNIFFNTDLKSYSSSSITATPIRKALKSLSTTIECARSSSNWQERYSLSTHGGEIRGLLFVYNHDANFDKNFYEHFSLDEKPTGTANRKRGLKVENLPLEKGQVIHIVQPQLINFMTTIIADSQALHSQGTFPQSEYFFYYPELTLHKLSGEKKARAATIEMISGPYIIIGHPNIKKYNEVTKAVDDTVVV